MTRQILIAIIAAIPALLLAQQPQKITLNNPSFEDFPRQGQVPRGWYDCSFESETPPDIHPSLAAAQFEVTKEANDGNTYIGMVVRDNETWEMISQRLKIPLQKGQCYDFSIDIARSILYQSQSRVTEEPANYATPCKLRIWGGNSYCGRVELLAESKEVINTRWLRQSFRFEPTANYYYINLEVYYKTPVLFPYNGNILLDNASDIVPVPCGQEEPIVKIDPQVKEKTPPVKKEEPKTPPVAVRKDPTPTPKPPVTRTPPPTRRTVTNDLMGVDRRELVAGKKLRINQLYFEADKADIRESSFSVLNQVYDFLKDNKDVVIEVGGHTNGIPDHPFCDSLSTLRAQAVANYLISKGLNEKQVRYKGYGKRQLIANDRTLAGRRRNQRVELKILSINS